MEKLHGLNGFEIAMVIILATALTIGLMILIEKVLNLFAKACGYLVKAIKAAIR